MTLVRMKQKRGTSAQWASANPILLDGELGLDTTNRIVKIGNGATHWASLPALIDPAALPAAIAALVGAAPETLDTIEELAAALADSGDATALTALIGEKLAKDQNLADVPDPAAARINLGIGGGVKSTVGPGLPTFSQRVAGDLHRNTTDDMEYVLTGAAGGHAVDAFNRDVFGTVSDDGATYLVPSGAKTPTLVGNHWVGSPDDQQHFSVDLVSGLANGATIEVNVEEGNSTGQPDLVLQLGASINSSTGLIMANGFRLIVHGNGWYLTGPDNNTAAYANGVSGQGFAFFGGGGNHRWRLTVVDHVMTAYKDDVAFATATGVGTAPGTFAVVEQGAHAQSTGFYLDTFSALNNGTLEWEPTVTLDSLGYEEPDVPTTPATGKTKSTLSAGLPGFAGRLAGDLHFDTSTRVLYELYGVVGGGVRSDTFTTRADDTTIIGTPLEVGGVSWTNMGQGSDYTWVESQKVRGKNNLQNVGVNLGAAGGQSIEAEISTGNGYGGYNLGNPVAALNLRSSGSYNQGYWIVAHPFAGTIVLTKNTAILDGGTPLASAAWAGDGKYTFSVSGDAEPVITLTDPSGNELINYTDTAGSVPNGTYGGFAVEQSTYRVTRVDNVSAQATGTLTWLPIKGNPVESMTFDLTMGATKTLPSPKIATMHQFVMTADCVFTFPTPSHGESITLVLKQDATGGHTPTWPSNVDWGDAGAPVISPTANKRTVISFVCPSTVDNKWLGFLAGKGFS